MPRITFTLKKNGTVEAEADGFKGTACKAKIDELLRGTQFQRVADDEMKDDFYETEPDMAMETG